MPSTPKLPLIGELQVVALHYEDGLFDTPENSRLMGCINQYGLTSYYEYSVFTPVIEDLKLNSGKVSENLRTWFLTATVSVGNRYSRTLIMVLADSDNIKFEIHYEQPEPDVERWTVNTDVPDNGGMWNKDHAETQKTLFTTTDYDELIEWLNTPYKKKFTQVK